ncbi:MAG: hypothetical protein WKF57_06565 [Nakamurella sp.]
MTSEITVSATNGLPLDIAGSLMRALAAMWPTSKVRSDPGGLTLIINDVDRGLPIDFDTIPAPDTADPATADYGLTGWKDGVITVGMGREAAEHLAVWAHTALVAYDAVNYLEQTAFTPEGRRVEITAKWGHGSKSPHQLRQAAEDRVTELEAHVAGLEAELRELRGEPE